MRLAIETSVLETNVVGDSQVFQINATGAAFRTLIDGLYSNKEQSIVRELAANAWDSQKRAGTSRPFHIQSPTPDEPYFSVRDYGVGMTHTKVMSLYTTLFMSDKSEDNKEVGMFGLGSKSPFAYTDQFNLSCYDGKNARHYSCAIGPASVPQINVIAQLESDEPRGVHVSFAVRPNDFQKFRDAIEQVSFGHDPCFETNRKTLPSRGKIAIEGKGWRSYTDSHIPSQWVVRQGCVIYPLTETGGLRLPSDAGSRKYMIECPIGTIQVTASRESISYRPEVVEYLRDRIDHIKNEAEKFVREQTASISNVWDFFNRIVEIKPNFVEASFVHPPTGLTSIGYKLPEGGVEVRAKNNIYAKQWGYSLETELSARKQNDVLTNVVVVTGYKHILQTDVERDSETFFTPLERRTLCLRLRGYAMEVLKVGKVLGWYGFDLDQKMLDHFYPNVVIHHVNYKDMPTGIKRQPRGDMDDREDTPIRGVYLVPMDGGRIKSTLLADIADDQKTAWVLADFYRRDPSNVREIAKKLGVERLFTSTVKASPRMTERGVPSIEQFVARTVPWDDLLYISEEFGGWDNTQSNLLVLARVLHEHRRGLYDSILRSKSIFGILMRRIQYLIPLKAVPFGNHFHQSTLKMLNEEEKKKQRKLKPSPELTEAVKWMRNLDNRSSPFSLLLKGMHHRANPKAEQVEEIAQVLIAVSKLIPPEKYLK